MFFAGLEEDLVSALEAPCACTGTQRHAHHACIQRWVDEKGNARCEICEQPYRGSYTVPPPPPAALPADTLPLFTPMYILEASDPRHPYHQQRLDAMLDADHGLYQRNHSVSWCITFIIFFMFMVVLHHTLVVADGMDDGSGAGGAPGGGGMSPGASPDPSGGGGMAPGGDGDGNVATDLLLFLFWLATKAFLIGIPLLAVMRVSHAPSGASRAREEERQGARFGVCLESTALDDGAAVCALWCAQIASRQAQREHYEAMLQAASQYETNSRRMVIRVRANNPGGGTSSGNAASSSSSAAAVPAAGSGTPGGTAGPAAAGSGTQVAPPPPLATVV